MKRKGHQWLLILVFSAKCNPVAQCWAVSTGPSTGCGVLVTPSRSLFLTVRNMHTSSLLKIRFRRCVVQSTLGMTPLNLCFNILFYVFLLSLLTRITSALFIYDRRTLLDIGHHCTNLLQDTLSTDPAWPLEILRTTEVNKGRLNNPKRRRKHRGNTQQTEEKCSQSSSTEHSAR